MTIDGSAIATIKSIIDEGAKVHLAPLEGARPGIYVSSAGEVLDLSRHLPEPSRIEARPRFNDLDSLVRYLAIHDNDELQLWTQRSEREIQAIIDPHVPGSPSRETHTATATLQYHRVFNAWQRSCGGSYGQRGLVELLEELAPSIQSTTGAELVTLLSDLQFTITAEVMNATSLRTGATSVARIETVHSSKGKVDVEIPEVLEVRCPVIDGMDPLTFKVRLRYRIQDKHVVYTPSIVDHEGILEEAWVAVLATLNTLGYAMFEGAR